ncbi:NAD(P)-binding protein [Thozetella sp. PMI_491]|nr:NAD(P)-binding protein [Thozetella sp. PMI_491]
MTPYKKVVVIGKGLLGSAVVEQLATAGFEVTVLSRSSDSLTGLYTGVKVARVDYSSRESIINALRGQDVVISTVASEAIRDQRPFIDAAIEAGVKRFIPSDFGTFNTDPKAQEVLGFLKPFRSIQDYLAEKAEEGVLEYTVFSNGGFLDLVLSMGLFVDFQTRTARLFDDGRHKVSITSEVTVAKAIASSLAQPEASKNRIIFIHDTVSSQAKILALAKKHSTTEWTEVRVDGEAEYQDALALAGDEEFKSATSYRLLGASILAGKFHSVYKTVDNDWLGLGYLSDEELEAKVAALCK